VPHDDIKKYPLAWYLHDATVPQTAGVNFHQERQKLSDVDDETLNRFNRTFRGIVFSMRPSLARSVGFVTSLDDLLTVEGVRAWGLALQIMQAESAERFAPTSRFAQWATAEVDAEKRRWQTVHLLAESVESRLDALRPGGTWGSSAMNAMAFSSRIRQGEAVFTVDLVGRFAELIERLTLLSDDGHWESIEHLVEELNVLLSFPVYDMTTHAPSILNRMFTHDLAIWLAA
jgi:hypothetical protein